jgi:hypothetical protein
MRKVFLALIALAGFQVSTAHAALVESSYTYFDLIFSCPTCDFALPSSPIFLTTESNGIDEYLIEAAGGVTLLSSQAYAGNDNEIWYPGNAPTYTGPFDSGGLSFEFGGNDYNFYCEFPGCYIITDAPNAPDPPATFSASLTSATPLPAALPLFAGGISVIGLIARRKKRKAAGPAAA